MTKIHFTSLILCILTQSISASCIWHHPDSLVVLPQEDSVAYMEDYTCYSVLRSADTVSAPLWSFVANDTIRYGVLTDGVKGYDSLNIIYKNKSQQEQVYDLFVKTLFRRTGF